MRLVFLLRLLARAPPTRTLPRLRHWCRVLRLTLFAGLSPGAGVGPPYLLHKLCCIVYTISASLCLPRAKGNKALILTSSCSLCLGTVGQPALGHLMLWPVRALCLSPVCCLPRCSLGEGGQPWGVTSEAAPVLGLSWTVCCSEMEVAGVRSEGFLSFTPETLHCEATCGPPAMLRAPCTGPAQRPPWPGRDAWVVSLLVPLLLTQPLGMKCGSREGPSDP